MLWSLRRPIDWDRALTRKGPAQAPCPRPAQPRLAGPSSVVIDEVPDQEALVTLQLEKIRLQNRIEEQLEYQVQINKHAERYNPGSVERGRALTTFNIYQRNIDVLRIDLGNVEIKIVAYSEAIVDAGARPDRLEHAQLTALKVELPRSSSSGFAQDFYEARAQAGQQSEFRQSAYECAVKVLEVEVTDVDREETRQQAQSPGQPSAPSALEALVARAGGCLITDVDSSVSEYTEQ